MPSPFPGMDPYLEDPHIWPEFHNSFACAISGMLNRQLPQQYFAITDIRDERGFIGLNDCHSMLPETNDNNELIRAAAVAIRDARQGGKVVTLIEIISPSIKQSGEDRRNYLHKRDRITSSGVSLVEIDLLREGTSVRVGDVEQSKLLPQMPGLEYFIAVFCPWWRIRKSPGVWGVYGCRLTEPLPAIGIPLREMNATTPWEKCETSLNLQCAFEGV